MRKMGRWAAPLAAAVSLLRTGAAYGYGVELPENGTIAFGRAGAVQSTARDASGVMHNIATIGDLRGLQLSIGSNLSSFTHCFQRQGNYDTTANATVNVDGTRFDPNLMEGNSEPRYAFDSRPTAYPQICKEPGVGLAPMILGSYRLSNRITLGFGIFSPSTQGSAQNFPDTVTARDSMGNSFDAPSPARYLLFRKQLTVLYPTFGASFNVNRFLRVGAALHVGFANFQFGLHSNADRTAPQSPSSDVFIGLNATGILFGFSAGVQVMPTSNLTFGANLRYTAPVDASGEATTRFNPYGTGATPAVDGGFTIDSMRVSLPWNVRASARYHMPRAGRPQQNDGTGQYDAATDDVFDIEATFIYERTSNLSETSLRNTGSINTSLMPVPAPPELTIRSALADVIGVRIGGDYNVVPGRLAVRAGFSMESRGASPDLAQIHLPAYSGMSVHAGATYRFGRRVGVSLGFGHFFFNDNNAATAQRAVTVPSPQLDPATACATSNSIGAGGCQINRGLYTASMTSGSVALHLFF